MDGPTEFTYPRTNLILSDRGFSVEIRGRSTIRYADAENILDIFAESLVRSEPTMIIRSADARASDGPETSGFSQPERDEIIDNIRRAFGFKDWVLLVE